MPIYAVRIPISSAESVNIEIMASLIGDIKFSADMLLALIGKFINSHPEEFNAFKGDDNSELLSAEVSNSRFYKSFGIDVEKIRHTLNK